MYDFGWFTDATGMIVTGRKSKLPEIEWGQVSTATLVKLQLQTVDALNELVAVQKRRACIDDQHLTLEQERLQLSKEKLRIQHAMCGLEVGQVAPSKIFE